MKKFILFLFALAIVSFSCNKDDDDPTVVVNPTVVTADSLNPTQTQWGWTLEYTRTNCGSCGATGGPLLYDLLALGNVVGVAAHCAGSTDPMVTTIYQGFYSDRPSGGGIPSFWVGDEKVSTGGTDAVDEMNTLLGKTPCAGVDISFSISGNKMTVKTKSKFFSAETGDFLLSVYILEDGIDGSESSGLYNQSGAGVYTHRCVLRAASLDNVYGEALATNPANDKVVEKTYEFTLDSEWTAANCYPAAMIWKYDSSADPEHVFINAIKKK